MSKFQTLRRLVCVSFLTGLWAVSQGCMKATILEYEPFIRNLDGKNELYISTYPSDFPRETASIPFMYKKLRSPESVYFQVFIEPI